jgi:hypothetical protein
MKDKVVRTRAAARPRRDRAARPAVEGLEGRLLLYAYTGDHFAYGNLITWSIMPDGTNLGGTTSNLVSTLNARLGAGAWQQAIADAFAQWENYGNINVAQVGDDGSPFNSGGYQQGAPNFGDIRIGGFAQASNVLAFTMLPPAANGGSDSGDIFFNTNQLWNINSTFDLETVAVHEIGHAVAGLGESSDPNAAEYEYYTGIKQGLGQDDVNGIQAVWGPRAPDAFTRAYGNTTAANAANLTGYINPQSNQIYLANLDVASSANSYWYKVTTPPNANNYLWVQVQSAGWSELSPKVAIYNSSLQGLTQVSASTTTYGTTLYAAVGNVTPGQTYYIKVGGSSVLANGTGDYALGVDLGTSPLNLVASPVYPIAAQPDQGGGGIFSVISTPGASFDADGYFNSMVQNGSITTQLSSAPYLIFPIFTGLSPFDFGNPGTNVCNWWKPGSAGSGQSNNSQS